MFRRFSANFAVFSIFLDLVLVDAALLVSAYLRAPLGEILPQIKDTPPVLLPAILFVIFPVLWVGVLAILSVYDGRKNLRVVDEITCLVFGSLLAVAALAGVLYLSYRETSRFLFLMAAFLTIGSMLLWRFAARLAFRKQGLHSRARRVLVLGAGEIGRRVAAVIRQNPGHGLAITGFLDDNPALSGEVIGPLDRTRQVVQQQQIDDVVVALPMAAHERASRVVGELHDLPVRVWVVPDYFALILQRAITCEIAGMPMLDLRAPAMSEYQMMVKRAFDGFMTLLAMPFVLPLMGLIALAIRLDSPGPVLYFARRAGENGRIFRMCKFRTMVVGADELLQQVTVTNGNGDHIHKTPHDPRVTRVGRFLRRTSLDELPQLFNVLKGEMSLVGPRPELPELVEKYDLWQRKRFSVPQGMTGWWQVNGRSDKPMHLFTEEDLFYVQHYSIWLDLRILFKTAWVVLRGKGAY